MIFETQRLQVRKLQAIDKDLFFKMMSNPNVMLPIPQKPMNKIESDQKFLDLLSGSNPRTINIWAVAEKEKNIFLGICGFLKNDEQDNEIAYRFIERHWGLGYGTEIAKGLIDYGFNQIHSTKIMADVNVVNTKSVKILEKFMIATKEFYNEKDQCTDRRYAIYKTK